MRKQGKKIVAFLLLLTMLLSQADILSLTTKASTETNTETIDIKADNFTFLKTSYFDEGDMYVSNGRLVADYEKEITSSSDSNSYNVHKKALLKECKGGYIDTFKVSVSPASDATAIMDATLWMGVQPGTDGTVDPSAGAKEFPGIRFRYKDAATGNNVQELTVDLYDGEARATLLSIKDTANDNTKVNFNNSDDETDTTDNSPAKIGTIDMELTVSADNKITWKLSLQDDPTQYVEKEIDLSDYPSLLKGQVGVGAFSRGASFDNLSITYKELASQSYDFSDSSAMSDFLSFSENKTVTADDGAYGTLKCDGNRLTAKYVYGTTGTEGTYTNAGGYHQKIIYKSDIGELDTVSVDMAAAENSDGKMQSCLYLYAGARNDVNDLGQIYQSFSGLQGLVITFLDTNGARSDGFYLRAQFHSRAANTSATTTYKLEKSYSGSNVPEWYIQSANTDEITMQVEVMDRNDKDEFLVTIMDKDNPTNEPVEWSLSIEKLLNGTTTATEAWKHYMSTTIAKSFGVGNWYYGGCFDNLAVNGKMLTLDGIADSQITVNNYGKLPTGADFVDGKYVLGWELDNGNAVDTYNGYQGSYIANVVDPAMLTVLHQETDSYSVTNSKNKTYDARTIRFIASLNQFKNEATNEFENYKSAGFVFTTDATIGTNVETFKIGTDGCAKKQTYKLYSKLLSGPNEVTADAEYGGNGYAEYFFAFELSDAPEGATVYARAYVELENGTVVYGQPKIVTVTEVQ